MCKHNSFNFYFSLLLLIFGSCTNKTPNDGKKDLSVRGNTPHEKKINLTSSDPKLNKAFSWATKMALSYLNDYDPVGPWYEGALPQRESFCMRDVSHMSVGAYYLGLNKYNKNMLSKFAQNISPSRDYCSYWEINKNNKPTPVDYNSDEDFWYNLPANFDVMFACYQMYMLTGDENYLVGEPFYSFHSQSVHEYVSKWDSDKDGIMNSPVNKKIDRRGLGSYEERIGGIATGADLVGAQAKGYQIFSEIMKLKNKADEAEKFSKLNAKLKADFNSNWWDSGNNTFYGYKLEDGTFSKRRNGAFILYFGIVDDKNKIKGTLEQIEKNEENVETNSYAPMIFFKYGKPDKAYKYLIHMADPAVNRRTYPEVSYSFVGSVAEGLMGLTLNAPANMIETNPNFPTGLDWVELDDIPWKNNHVNIKTVGSESTSLTSYAKDAFLWRVTFKGNCDKLWVNKKRVEAQKSVDSNGNTSVFASIRVDPGQTYTVARTE